MPAPLSCSTLGARDYRAAVELLTDAFCRDDPVETALEIAPDEFRVMVELELAPLLQNGLSLVARRADSDGLVGAVIAADALAEAVDGRGRISRKFEPIGAIARAFHDAYLSRRHVEPGSSLYIFMVGVRPDCSGQGIAKRLIAAALANAAARGYACAFAMTTNRASTQAFASQGFTVVDTLSYRSYRYQDRPVFAAITAHPGIALLERADLAV